MACLSDHPLRHIGGTTLRDRLVHVETAWMGVGPRCRGIVHGCYQPTSPRLPPTPPLVAHWRGQLARCLGFDGAATAPLRPLRLMVVDREFGNSRHACWVGTGTGVESHAMRVQQGARG